MTTLFKLSSVGISFWLLLLISCGADSTPVTAPTISSTPTTLNTTSKKGRRLFLNNCAACHNINMVDDMTGPALYGVEERWEKRSELIQFIQNPQELINNNHPRAVEVAALWASEMTAFPDLDSADIVEILAFIEEKGAKNN